MKWLLEADVFDKDEQKIIETLKKLGVKHTVCKFGKSYDEYIADEPANADIVFHGSFQFAREIQQKARWTGLFCNLPKLECLYYYPKFGQHLLNSDYVMLPFGELHRRKKWLLESIGKNSSIFLRPSNGYKSFTGKVVTEQNWDKDIKLLGFYDLEPHELVVAAPPVHIMREWRAIVVSGKVVAASLYRVDKVDVRIIETPREVLDYAERVCVATKYQPDPAWTIDIGETDDGQLKVIEVGSFSCAGFYAADPEPIIKAVGKLYNG
jgi:hypothetical protein